MPSISKNRNAAQGQALTEAPGSSIQEWPETGHPLDFVDFLDGGLQLDANNDSTVHPVASERKSHRSSTEAISTNFEESIFEYCESFESRASLNRFARNLLNVLQPLAHADTITLFLFHSSNQVQPILEKRQQVFVSGLHKPLSHSVETLVKHFCNGQYLISQSEPLIYLPLMLEEQGLQKSSHNLHNRLLGFLQLITSPNMQKSSIPYLWMHIQRAARLLAQILDYQHSILDTTSGLYNAMAFRHDCVMEFTRSQEQQHQPATQLTLWNINQFLDNNVYEQQRLSKFSKVLKASNSTATQAKHYRLTQNVFACLELALCRKSFAKKVEQLCSALEKQVSFSMASIICNRDLPSAQSWLKQAVYGLA